MPCNIMMRVHELCDILANYVTIHMQLALASQQAVMLLR